MNEIKLAPGMIFEGPNDRIFILTYNHHRENTWYLFDIVSKTLFNEPGSNIYYWTFEDMIDLLKQFKELEKNINFYFTDWTKFEGE